MSKGFITYASMSDDDRALLGDAFRNFMQAMEDACKAISKVGAQFNSALRLAAGFTEVNLRTQTPFERSLARAHNDHLRRIDRMDPTNV